MSTGHLLNVVVLVAVVCLTTGVSHVTQRLTTNTNKSYDNKSRINLTLNTS